MPGGVVLGAVTGRALARAAGRASAGGFIALVLLFILAPLIVIVGASFDGGAHGFINFPPHQISLAWYRAIPARYLQALGFSMVLGLSATAIALLLGVPAALGLVRGRVPGLGLIAGVFRAPLQIPAIVIGISFLQSYYLLASLLGLKLVGSFAGLLAGHVFIITPYIVGSVVAVLAGFNTRLEEAAYSLGEGTVTTFFRVTLPVIAPGVYTGALYGFVTSFGDVPVSLFLGGTAHTPFPVEMFSETQFDFNPAILSVSTLVILLSVGLMLAAQRISGATQPWRSTVPR